LRDKGIPNLNSFGKGDQIIYINLHVPQKLSQKEKDMLKELSQSENICPNKKSFTKPKDFFEKLKDVFF
ncbi:MAG: molecular chaperone DnaJ, partial [Bacteroidota bacterium]|nr:molecular chaperone DnaJ [Bacteroidota bacterium]